MQQPLPREWVERLFARFMARYGVAWTRMWEGVDPEAVLADWSEEMAGYQTRPDALKYALQYLPIDKPPTVQQFRAICNAAPEANPPPALPPPPTSPEVVAAVRQLTNKPRANPLQWAENLRLRETGLERLTPFQRRAWRDALLEQPSVAMSAGDFTPPPRDVLPPAMQEGA
jgi:hypothetical protein